jgi:hypothetical protein
MANVVQAIQNLVGLFKPHCADTTTLDELLDLAADHTHRHRGHDLFYRIRKKTGRAHAHGYGTLEAQYQFEEVCAKTLYNLGHNPAPFDPDVPFRIIPAAFTFARLVKIGDAEIVSAIKS